VREHIAGHYTTWETFLDTLANSTIISRRGVNVERLLHRRRALINEQLLVWRRGFAFWRGHRLALSGKTALVHVVRLKGADRFVLVVR